MKVDDLQDGQFVKVWDDGELIIAQFKYQSDNLENKCQLFFIHNIIISNNPELEHQIGLDYYFLLDNIEETYPCFDYKDFNERYPHWLI